MGRICAVLGCTSGSQTEKKVHGTRCRKIFKVPMNAEKRQRWIDALGIALTAKDTICELHFAERDIERANFFKVGNTISILPRERTTLRKDAIPQRKVFDQDKNAIADAPTIDGESSVSVKENVSETTIPQVIDHQQVPDQREVIVPDAPMIDCKNSVSAEENIEVIDEDKNGIDPGMPCDALLTMADVKKVLAETGLPIAWSWAISPIRSDEIVLIQIDPVTLQVRLYLHVHSDLSVTMSTSDNVGKIKLDFLITTISLLEDLIASAETAVLCSGSGVKAQSRSKHCSAIIVQEENRRQTITPRCINCKKIRKAHLNKCYRATTDLKSLLHSKYKVCLQQRQYRRLVMMNRKLRSAIIQAKAACAAIKEDTLAQEVAELPKVQQQAVKTVFQAAQVPSSCGRRYSIEWVFECLRMRIKSGKLYEHLRTRNIFPVPSKDTLGTVESRGVAPFWDFRRQFELRTS